MAKSYKRKKEQEEVVNTTDSLSKKELYDLEKEKRVKLKEKEQKKKATKVKVSSKLKKANIKSRIFAIFMLVLMVSSVLVSALAYVFG